MIKIFPKSRVCVIDCHQSFQDGLRDAVTFCRKHNILLNGLDGKRLIATFCIKNIEKTYKTTKSQYPKVLCLLKTNSTKKVEKFVELYFDKIVEHLPFPYCGKYDSLSPDLEAAAESSLLEIKSKQRFKKFKINLKIRDV